MEFAFFRGESLYDGTIGVAEIADANDAIDLMMENRYRVSAHKE